MTVTEVVFAVITIIFAFYGAGLSTYLWLARHRRKIEVILEHVSWQEVVRVIIVNSGYRPVTILGIGGIGAEKHEGGLMREGIYSGDLIERDEWKKIPATLKDGEQYKN